MEFNNAIINASMLLLKTKSCCRQNMQPFVFIDIYEEFIVPKLK